MAACPSKKTWFLIPKIAEVWNTRREEVASSSESILQALRSASEARAGGSPLEESILQRTYEELSAQFDEQNGGFGSAPKFPSPHNLLFLLRYRLRSGEQRALEMVEKTLTEMRRGGIYDHVGYGFHRYSTDARWRVPHFEKMLYDQALIARAFEGRESRMILLAALMGGLAPFCSCEVIPFIAALLAAGTPLSELITPVETVLEYAAEFGLRHIELNLTREHSSPDSERGTRLTRDAMTGGNSGSGLVCTGRAGSNRSGSGQSAGSRFAAPSTSATRSPGCTTRSTPSNTGSPPQVRAMSDNWSSGARAMAAR